VQMLSCKRNQTVSCIHFSKQFSHYISNTMKYFDLYERTTVLFEEINCKCDKNTESIRTWFLGMLSNISKFVALLKGTILKEMFQELFVWPFIILQYVTYINNYFSRTIFILILNKLYLIVNSTIIIQKENVAK